MRMVEVERLACGDPLTTAGGNAAIRLPDILADGRVGMVVGKGGAQPQFLPHLSEARVDIEVDPLLRAIQNFRVAQESHDVQQHCRLASSSYDLALRQSDAPLAAIDCQRKRAVQVEALHHT